MNRRLVSLCFAILLMAGCSTVNRVTPFGTGHDDSNTVNPLPTPGASSFASTTKTFLQKEDANRWSEQGAPFQNWVSIVAQANSCLGAAGAGLTMTPTACTAYNAGYRGTDTHSITFPNASTCWVAMDENTAGSNPGLGNFTRVSGSHYLIDCIDVGQPAMVADSQLLMKVVTAGGAITVVTDLRTTKAVSGGGSVTSITATTPVVVTPSPLISTGVVSITTVPANLGGSGSTGITAHDPVIAEGTSPMVGVAMAADTFLQGQGAAADPTAGAIPGCASDGVHALTYAGHALACTSVSGSVSTHGSQLFTSSGTFTVPANVFQINVQCWGSGGGGGGFGAGLGPATNASAATTAVYSATTECSGGPGEAGTGAAGGASGAGGAAGAATQGLLNVKGTPGQPGTSSITTLTGTTGGGIGGVSFGMPFSGTDSSNAGNGGPGGGDGAGHGGGGGGAGGYSERSFTVAPAGTVAITIGNVGAAGTGGTANGSAGIKGVVLVTW